MALSLGIRRGPDADKPIEVRTRERVQQAFANTIGRKCFDF
jgi:hypothetical protein